MTLLWNLELEDKKKPVKKKAPVKKKKTKKKEEPAPEAPKGPSQEDLLTEIRDLLSKK